MRKFLRNAKQKKLFSQEIHLLLDVGAVILVWRGIWNLIDTYLLPNNPVISAVLGLFLGLLILFLDNFSLDELR